MTIKDCIIKAAKYLGLDDFAYSLEYSYLPPDKTDAFNEMACNVIREICTDYYPLIKTETVAVPENGEFLIKLLSETPLDILTVKKDGVSCPFRLRYNRFETAASGECEVEYSFMPELTSVTLKLPLGEKIDARIIGFGIAAEYCIINGLDDAVIWDKRYKDALKKAIRSKGERRVKKRSWK